MEAGTYKLYTADADLYEVAFSWDTSDEIDWLLQRLGNDCAPILEPACGSGRYLVAFGKQGIEAVGIDSSREMVSMSHARLRAEGLSGDAVLADMTNFHLDRLFGGAICPIDSLAYLLDERQLANHFRCMGEHLRSGSTYLVQLELRDPDDPWHGLEPSIWENERDGVRVRTDWRVEEIDIAMGVETQRGIIECLSGPGEGRVFEEVHRFAAWTPQRWVDVIADSPFTYLAVYDGDSDDRPSVPIGTVGRLLWHELMLDS